jgi:hypothetical protein
MRAQSTLSTLALAILPALALAAVDHGEWTLSSSGLPGKVEFSLQSSWSDDHHFSTSSDWSISDLRGLDWSTAGKHDVRFTIARDAGTIECEGFVRDGSGAGLFTFHANPQYASEMAALGFSGVSDERQFAFAIHDVSLAFARDIKAAGVNGLDANKLIAFRIHGVSPEFVRGLRTAGLDTGDNDKLIAFRIHGVSPEYVNELARLGYSHPAADELIALRIHGVTPEYIEKLQARGVQNLTLRQLVALRIHGID